MAEQRGIMDSLSHRLRGQYSNGPGNAYGYRDFSSFIPPICIEAADALDKRDNLINSLDKNTADILQEVLIYGNSMATYMRILAELSNLGVSEKDVRARASICTGKDKPPVQ